MDPEDLIPMLDELENEIRSARTDVDDGQEADAESHLWKAQSVIDRMRILINE